MNISNKIFCTVCEKDSTSRYALLVAKRFQDHTNDYEIFLCESCFFNTYAHFKAQKKLLRMFDRSFDLLALENLGLKQK